MININTGSETFYAYAFNVGGFVGKVDSPSVEGVLDAATIWPDVVRLDVYVDNDEVYGLWVGTYDLRTRDWDGSNPQTVTA